MALFSDKSASQPTFSMAIALFPVFAAIAVSGGVVGAWQHGFPAHGLPSSPYSDPWLDSHSRPTPPLVTTITTTITTIIASPSFTTSIAAPLTTTFSIPTASTAPSTASAPTVDNGKEYIQYSVVPGYFLQDLNTTNASTFDFVRYPLAPPSLCMLTIH